DVLQAAIRGAESRDEVTKYGTSPADLGAESSAVGADYRPAANARGLDAPPEGLWEELAVENRGMER
ncbi:MAG TPA: hypothetical protein VGC99_06715, partial [Candidatus Tectomicrobia bacterium]